MRSRLSRTAVSGIPTVTKSPAGAGIHVHFHVDDMRINTVNRRGAGSKEGHSM